MSIRVGNAAAGRSDEITDKVDETRLDSTCAHVRLSGAFPAMSYVSDKTETMHIFSR